MMIKKLSGFLAAVVFFPVMAHAGLFAYYDKGTELYGFKDSKGRVIIRPQFERIYVSDLKQELFSPKNKEFESLVPVLKNGRLWRITQDGKAKFETVFFDNGPDYYEEGLSRFLKNGKVGFHDPKGKVVIEPEYDFAAPFRDGKSRVCADCHLEYPKMPTFAPLTSSILGKTPREEMYPDVVGGKWGVIDKKGKFEPIPAGN